MMTSVLDHLWQSSLFALCLGLTTFLFRRNGAHVRYWIWFAASVKFLIPFSLLAFAGNIILQPLMSFESDVLRSLVQSTSEIAVAPSGFNAIAQSSILGFLAYIVWYSGFCFMLLRWLVRQERLRDIVTEARPFDLSASVPVLSSSSSQEPGLVGISHPVLLLPEGIAQLLSPAEMYAVIAHEISHLERRDNLTAFIHMLVETVFWFHPLVWWLGARLMEERERACDERVISCGVESDDYAQGILKVCQHYLRTSLGCAAGISGADLKSRIEAIMASQEMVQLGLTKKALVGIAAAIVMVVPVMGGALSPQAASFGGARNYFAYESYIEALRRNAPYHDDLGLFLVLQGKSPVTSLAKRTGAFKSLKFKGLSTEGWEVYDVAFESARAEWRIAPAAGRKIAGTRP